MAYDKELAKEKWAAKNARRKAGREGVGAAERIDARNMRRSLFPHPGCFGNAGAKEFAELARGTTGKR